tara:strand:+ start:47 stop:361 length:315 start_codon:yes stop_codon:yes gene_type:complete
MKREFFFNDDDEEKKFLIGDKDYVCKLIVSAIEESVAEGLSLTHVFTTVNSNRDYVITSEVKKEDWVESLEKCLGYFVDGENYEWCDKIKKLKLVIENGDNKTD